MIRTEIADSHPPIPNHGRAQACTVFLDLNGNLAQDSGEPSGVTDAAGHFSIALNEVRARQGAFN